MSLKAETPSEQAARHIEEERARELGSFGMFEEKVRGHYENVECTKIRIGIRHYVENLCQFHSGVKYWRGKFKALGLLPNAELEDRLVALRARIEEMITPLVGEWILVEEEVPDQQAAEPDRL